MKSLILLICASAIISSHAQNRGKQHRTSDAPFLTPKQAVEKMSIPEGFDVSIYASEPHIGEPIAFTFDARGRVWVVENYNYVNRRSHKNEQLSRIQIFEDTDGDGVFDTKKLFHDKSLSKDGTISCATCHHQDKAFTDGLRLSKGINKQVGDRNSMPLFNLAWKSSFFWDGRSKSLRNQVLQPIQDHREMASDLNDVVKNLTKTSKDDFKKAFGPGEITEEKISLALENFLLTLTSYDSRFDQAMSGKAKLTPTEERGMKLFFTEYEPRSRQYGADCFHCHGGANFSDHQLHNNGLGGSFSTPSLRNLVLTAPYMHDGRFKTLEEVVAHYSGPITRSKNLDPNLAKHPKAGLQLKKKDQEALVAFLKTLTDPKYR